MLSYTRFRVKGMNQHTKPANLVESGEAFVLVRVHARNPQHSLFGVNPIEAPGFSRGE